MTVAVGDEVIVIGGESSRKLAHNEVEAVEYIHWRMESASWAFIWQTCSWRGHTG
jgi:hypothetical protein